MNLVRIEILLQLLTLLATSAIAFDITVTIEAPARQRTTATLVYGGVETFDTLSLGHHFTYVANFSPGIQGTYTGLEILPRDVFGGAHGVGRYPVARSHRFYTLTLTQTGPNGINYFGFWLSALDAGNQLSIFSLTGQIFRLSPSDVLALVKDTLAYYGNPTYFPRTNMAEPYVFINFFCNDCLIARVEFRQTTTSGYESDNHTVGFFLTQSGTEVPIKTTTTTATTATATTTTATTTTATTTTATTTTATTTTATTTTATTTTATTTTATTTTTVTTTKEATPVIPTTGAPPTGEDGGLAGGVIAAIVAATAGGMAAVAGAGYQILKPEPKPEPIEGVFMDDASMELAEWADEREQMAEAVMI